VVAGVFIFGIGAAVIGAVWFIARRAAWADVRPGLTPLECFGDFPALPAEAKRPGGIGSGGGRSKTHRVETHGGTHTTRRPGEAE
jgi:hypothetical protein